MDIAVQDSLITKRHYWVVTDTRLTTMHQARGPEFREVFVVGASAEELPDPAPMKHADTDEKRRVVDESERRLLHVSATRATHGLRVSLVGEPTDYLGRCAEVADCRSGFDVAQCLGCELDTAALEEDPAGFRVAGQDYVAGGRQIARVLTAHLQACDEASATTARPYVAARRPAT